MVVQVVKNLRDVYWQARRLLRRLVHKDIHEWQRYFSARLARATSVGPAEARHVLLLAWYFPPYVNGGVYRPAALTQYAAASGWQVSVLARESDVPPDPAGVHLAAKLPGHAAYLRIRGVRVRPYPVGLPLLDGGLPNAIEMFYRAKAWLAQRPPSIIVATGPPFNSFVAGYLLSRYFRCKLVLDYRDEWTDSPLRFREHLGWERRCLKRADRVVFTTQSQLEHYSALFPSLRSDKCRIVPNGWEDNDFPRGFEPLAARTRPTRSKYFVLSFVGLLGDHTLPAEFLATLGTALQARPDLAGDIRVRFIGKKSPRAIEQLAQFPLPDIVEQFDHVPLPRALEYMRESDALLILNNPSLARYLPGKLYYYVASGTPLLIFGAGGEIGELVSELDAGVVCNPRPESLASAIDALRSEVTRDTDRTLSWLKAHTRQATSERFVQILEELQSGSP